MKLYMKTEVIAPIKAPAITSDRKCWPRYIRVYPASTAAIKYKREIFLFFVFRARIVASAKADAVCPEGNPELFERLTPCIKSV